MDVNKPVSGELAALLPVLAETMRFAVQAARQSSALATVLIAKGVLTKAELDEAVRSTADPSKSLLELLDKNWKMS